MNNIARAFAGKCAFIPFITGGDPDLATTEKLLYALYEAGADLIEIGIPFSDPVAEGPVIEAAAARALARGCTVDQLFEMVAKVRQDIPVPIVFMTYYNAVFAYGAQRFIDRSIAAGLDGLIVPDLPFAERAELHKPCADSGLALISLIAPTTGERIGEIARQSEGFLYCVSSMGVTGVRQKLDSGAKAMIEQVRAVNDIPCAVGFGISNAEQAREVAQFADGVIVGSAIVRLIAEHRKECIEPVKQFAREIKDSIS